VHAAWHPSSTVPVVTGESTPADVQQWLCAGEFCGIVALSGVGGNEMLALSEDALVALAPQEGESIYNALHGVWLWAMACSVWLVTIELGDPCCSCHHHLPPPTVTGCTLIGCYAHHRPWLDVGCTIAKCCAH